MARSEVDEMAIDKPEQVTQAFYLLLISATVSLIYAINYAVLTWQGRCADQGPTAIFCWGLQYVVPFIVAFKVNRRRNWARWLVAVAAATSVFALPAQVRGFADFPIHTILSWASFGSVLIAAFLLFRGPSNSWFKMQAPEDAAETPIVDENSRIDAAESQSKDANSP